MSPIQQLLLGVGAGDPAPGVYTGTRGVVGGGQQGTSDGYGADQMLYFTIQTTANSVDFGDLSKGRTVGGGCSNGSRGCWYGDATYGFNSTFQTSKYTGGNTIDYITFASTGNATDFGNMTSNKGASAANASNGIRGTKAGGHWVLGNASPTGPYTTSDDIQYITIATTGNATALGTLADKRDHIRGASDGIYGYYGGGAYYLPYQGGMSTRQNVYQHNIATEANASSEGYIASGIQDWGGGGCGNNDRILWWGGVQPWSVEQQSYSLKIRYHTANVVGWASDFGELTHRRGRIGVANDLNRAVGCGGQNPAGQYDRNPAGLKMDYVTIATTANASTFGTLSSNNWQGSNASEQGQASMGGMSGT